MLVAWVGGGNNGLEPIQVHRMAPGPGNTAACRGTNALACGRKGCLLGGNPSTVTLHSDPMTPQDQPSEPQTSWGGWSWGGGVIEWGITADKLSLDRLVGQLVRHLLKQPATSPQPFVWPLNLGRNCSKSTALDLGGREGRQEGPKVTHTMNREMGVGKKLN